MDKITRKPGTFPWTQAKRKEDRTIFNLFKRKGPRKTMMEAVAEAKSNPAVHIVDVRTAEEFREGHVPGALNVPVDQMGRIQQLVPGKEAPVYLYCASGARSMMAVGMLRRMGYQDVTNVGGIHAYTGSLTRA